MDLRTFQERLSSGDTVVLAGLGDSLTQGWMVRRGFFEQAVASLKARYPSLEAWNAGVPGDTAAGGRERLPGLLARGADLVLVQFGINDAFSGVSPGRFRRDLEEICDAAAAAGAGVVLVVSCPLGPAMAEREVAPFYDVIRSLAADRGLPLADLHRHWRAAEAAGRGGGLHLADGVHPTEAGHGLMAEGVLAVLAPGR